MHELWRVYYCHHIIIIVVLTTSPVMIKMNCDVVREINHVHITDLSPILVAALQVIERH